MAENRQPDLESPNRPEAGHEPSDVNARALTKFGVIFILAGIASQFLVWGVFDYFRGREERKGPPPASLVNRDTRALPPEPRLQSAPVRDMKDMLAAEEQILDGYGWLDPSNSIVRIPVARAMELVAREGLPYRQQPAPAASTATVPKESGLGPLVHQNGGPLSPNRAFPPDQPLQIREGQAAGPPTPRENSLVR